MPYYPRSILPSRTKDESSDVAGNQYVVSAQDLNKVEDDVRAIEIALGAHSSDPTDPTQSRDALTALANALAALGRIRDDQVLATSGVVAAGSVIPFPATFGATTLVDAIPEAAATDEVELPSIDSLAVTDVSSFPDEGYVSVINDVSTAPVYASADGTLQLFGALNAYGKVGVPFQYAIGVLGGGTPTVSVTPSLPAGLVVSGGNVIGTPVAIGTGTWTITVTDGVTIKSSTVTYSISASGAPVLTAPAPWTLSASVGVPFDYAVPFVGIPTSTVSFSPFVPGISAFGSSIQGTPIAAGTTALQVVITDPSGDSNTMTLTMVVS